MEKRLSSNEYTLRLATAADAVTIRQMIRLVHINPISLNWQRFVLATDLDGNIIGCGQVKPHSDGSHELASIAVLPNWRSKGVARDIIEHLLNQYPGRLYLTCRSQLGPMYQNFGFQPIHLADMPPYFRNLSRLVSVINKLFHQQNRLLVMRRN